MTQQDLSKISDAAMISRIKSGQYSYFTPLFSRYQFKVMRLLSRYLDDHLDIEDVTQDVFIKVFHAIHDFRGDSLFFTWLYRIAINTANNFLNNKNRLDRFHVDMLVMSSEEDSVFLEEEQSHLDTPENIMFAKVMLQSIEDVISRLSQDMRQVLFLREYDGLSYEEIAKRMNCPIGTVRSRIFRAREMIETEIEQLKGQRLTMGRTIFS